MFGNFRQLGSLQATSRGLGGQGERRGEERGEGGEETGRQEARGQRGEAPRQGDRETPGQGEETPGEGSDRWDGGAQLDLRQPPG